MRWKYTILEHFNKFIKAPPAKLLQDKTAYYSKSLGSYIPKYILRDLYNYQTTLNKPSIDLLKSGVTVMNGTDDDDFGEITLQRTKRQKV